MEFLPIYAIFAMCFVVKGYSESIQCYECDDCHTLDDTLLKSCPSGGTLPISTTQDTMTTNPPETTTSADKTTTTVGEIYTETLKTDEESEQVLLPPTSSDPQVVQSNPANSLISRQVSLKSLMMEHYTRDTGSYRCYSIVRTEGDQQKIIKGCIEVPANKGACEVLQDQYGVSEENCKVCSESRCNSSMVLKCSLMLLVIVVVKGVFYK